MNVNSIQSLENLSCFQGVRDSYQHCTSNSMEDELHFTLECPLYQKQRKTILDNLYIKFPNLYNLDHPNLFIWMMSNDDAVFLSAFIEYLDNNFLSRKEKNII